jgi:hypothetical protein
MGDKHKRLPLLKYGVVSIYSDTITPNYNAQSLVGYPLRGISFVTGPVVSTFESGLGRRSPVTVNDDFSFVTGAVACGDRWADLATLMPREKYPVPK